MSSVLSCQACGAAMAEDQTYCLGCGARRASAASPFSPPAQAERAQRAPAETITPALAAAGVALASLFLGVGVLIGRSGSGDAPRAAEPTVVTVAGAGGSAGEQTASVAAFEGDWPDGASGWTVQLESLSKDDNDADAVSAAKRDAEDKGATAVGALDSDDFGSLEGGTYIVYSGRYDSKKQAAAALKKLKGDFPKAKVVEVNDGAEPVSAAKAAADKQKLENLEGLSGSDYAKQSRKLPETLALPGDLPPKDSKEGGGGSGFEEIK